jgi:polyhydroxyalkanoate synthase
VIVAPWINKYYILDLDAQKSLVRFLVSRGFTVFMTSWKNPGPEARDWGLEDYMLEGVLRAVEVAREITGAERVHAAGYCVGGTILTALMAWLNRDGAPPPIAHFTLLTALADFAAPGDIEFFIDGDSLEYLEGLMERTGYLDGGAMAWSFRMLRSNGLIWHYVVHGYLYGEAPPPLDVLYWNTDTTRLPARMHATYLRECYIKNALVQADGLTIGGRGIDLGRIDQPLYMVGTEQDHIAPWKETFKLCRIVQGPVRYVLATSGHIMGVVSPPVDPPKRRYWVGDTEGHRDPEAWRAALPKVTGSWWEDWAGWLGERCGPMVPPPTLGSTRHPVLADAPGTYVLER